ncbi:MAG: hypothetical protein R3344_12915, partial [Acidobacteriota bacterium]|nr:hypothetical protein [Acidobacteriota bacterium]
GDRGYRKIYGATAPVLVPAADPGFDARTLVRETSDGVRVCVYYPNAMIRELERHPPQHGLFDGNVDGFATLVEELDHLLCIAERVAEGRPVSLFELELHANVSKHLVLSRFLAGTRSRLGAEHKTWLRYHLFEKGSFVDKEPGVRQRYRDASRWGLRFLATIERLPAPGRIQALRRFHRAGATAKTRLIQRLAAT